MSHSSSRRGTAVPQQMSLIDQIYRHGRVASRSPHDTSPAVPTVSSSQDQSTPQGQISPSFRTPTKSQSSFHNYAHYNVIYAILSLHFFLLSVYSPLLYSTLIYFLSTLLSSLILLSVCFSERPPFQVVLHGQFSN